VGLKATTTLDDACQFSAKNNTTLVITTLTTTTTIIVITITAFGFYLIHHIRAGGNLDFSIE